MTRRRMLRTFASMIASFVLATLACAPSASGALDNGVYRFPYSADVFTVSNGQTIILDFAGWRALGFPDPVVLPTAILKYPWASEIVAVTDIQDGAAIAHRLTFDEWAYTGFVAPIEAPRIPGFLVYRYETSTELFSRFGTSGVSVRAQHKLTPDEWARMDYQRFEVIPGGYYTLSWVQSAVVAANFHLISATGQDLTHDQWLSVGSPTPQGIGAFPLDRVCYTQDERLYYSGLTFSGVITYDQWAATGFKQPNPLCRVTI